MKRKSLIIITALVFVMGLSGCGNNNGGKQNVVNSDTQDDISINNDKPKETEAQMGKEIKDKKVPKGVYKIGDYIKPGTYVLQNQTETSNLKVVLFNSEASYDTYNKSERFTVGEESEAIEKNAWQDVYLNNSETVYMNLEEGCVLVVDDAEVTMSSIELASMIGSEQSSSFDKALFVVGKDIPEGQYVFDCVETKGYSTEILLFESADTYTTYHVTSRFTIGEEQDAIDANSKASAWIQQDKSFSTYLSTGNIFLIDGGNVKISVME